jgi:hypothetical protein
MRGCLCTIYDYGSLAACMRGIASTAPGDSSVPVQYPQYPRYPQYPHRVSCSRRSELTKGTVTGADTDCPTDCLPATINHVAMLLGVVCLADHWTDRLTEVTTSKSLA